jgi:hypothetical protein
MLILICSRAVILPGVRPTSCRRCIGTRSRAFLLDRGADINALHGSGRASHRGYPAVGFQPVDLALWHGPFWGARGDLSLAKYLIERGADSDLVIAAARGDEPGVKALIERDVRAGK